MAQKKKRSQYFLTEPNWAEFSLAQTDEEKAAAWKKAQYFIHAEIPSKECYKTFRNWVNKFSKWDKKMKKKVLEAPDYAFLSISEYTWFHSKTGWMLDKQEEYIYNKEQYFLDTAAKKNAEKAQQAEQRKTKVTPIRREPVSYTHLTLPTTPYV